MRTWGITAAAIAGVVALAGCGSSGGVAPSTAATITIRGTLTVNGERSDFGPSEGGTCQPEGGYDDINAGAGVTIEDAAGKVIATGKLDESSTDLKPIDNQIDGVEPASCTFAFKVTGVPSSKFYKIGVSHRGMLSFSKKDVREPVALTLGSSS